jgi:hypothetical protein
MNDALTFNTAHQAGDVFFFRDADGDHAPVCTDAGRAHWESLCDWSWFFVIHGAPPDST